LITYDRRSRKTFRSTVSKSKRARRIRNRQRANAGRDAYTAARDLTIVNQYEASASAKAFQARSMPVVLAQLPQVARGFTGRDNELQVLAALLTPSDAGQTAAVMVSAVSGLAGVGKTALAVHAAHAARARGWFPGGVLFIDLHGYDDAPIEPMQALDALLRALGVATERIPPDAEARAALYRSVLAQTREPMLVVADNASSEAQVRPLLPGEGPHRLIVTSRHTLGGLQVRLVDVTALNAEASVALLDAALRIARPDDKRIAEDAEAAARLASICAGLPLALQIVAALLKSDPVRLVADLAAELAVERDRLERLRYDDGGGVREPSVAAAFEMSYRLLDEAAARMFRLLPLNPGPEISTAAVAALAGLPGSNARNILAVLAKAHLIESASTLAGRWRMHDLLRLYARRLSEANADADAAEQARDRLFGYYVRMTQAASLHLLAIPGVPMPSNFASRGDALAWLDAERPNLVATVRTAGELGKHRGAFDLSVVLVEYLSWKRYLNEWMTTAVIGLDAARGLGDRREEAGALSNLGLALQGTRQFNEAAAAHRSAAAVFRETGDRIHQGGALHNLGMALQGLRRFDEAISAYQQDLAICREVGDRYGQAKTLANLSICLRESARIDEAITTSRGAAEICREIGDRHVEGYALNALSGALAAAGQADQAIAASQDALVLLRETGDRHLEGMAFVNLANALHKAQRFDQAVTASQSAAAVFRETGDRHAQGVALVSLAGNLQEVQRLNDAITAGQEALDLARETGDRQGEGVVLDNLGQALREAQRLSEAVAVHQHAAAAFKETSDRNSEGKALRNLAAALNDTGDFERAIIAIRSAADIFRETGDRHAEGSALYELGLVLREMQRFGEAIAASQQAASLLGKFGDRNSQGQALGLLAALLGHEGRIEEAITASKRAIGIFQETGDQQDQAMALHNLGTAMSQADRPDEAIAAWRDAIAIFRETGDREREASALGNLAALKKVTRADEAAAAAQAAEALQSDTGQ
jgi:tetratricopeptide (TPR) repeat protein